MKFSRVFVLDRYFTINIYHVITALKVKYSLLVPVLFIRIINYLRHVESYMSIRPHWSPKVHHWTQLRTGTMNNEFK